MTGEGSSAALAALFMFAALPEEVTRTDAESILIGSGEFDCIAACEIIDELVRSGSLYCAEDGSVSITELGEDTAETFGDKREHYLSAINKAVREYRRITTGVEYRISLSQAENGGSYVTLERLYCGEQRLFFKLFFDKTPDALAAYNRIDRDPDSFYDKYITITTGKFTLE